MKTQPTKQSVAAFLNAIDDGGRRRDCKTVDKIMREVTKCKPVLWGNIIGYDTYTYTRKGSPKEYEFFRTGFSPRKNTLTIYIMPGYTDHQDLLDKLGPHKHSGRSCLYLKSLDDIDLKILKKLIVAGYKDMNKQYPPEKKKK